MFPLRDENPTVRTPIATFLLVGLNVAAWVLVQGLGSAEPLARSICALLPALRPGGGNGPDDHGSTQHRPSFSIAGLTPLEDPELGNTYPDLSGSAEDAGA